MSPDGKTFLEGHKVLIDQKADATVKEAKKYAEKWNSLPEGVKQLYKNFETFLDAEKKAEKRKTMEDFKEKLKRNDSKN